MKSATVESSVLFRDDEIGLLVELENGIATITFDQPNSPINTLGTRAAAAFARIFSLVEQNPDVLAVVFLSGKADTFIAGADIEELARVTTPLEGEELSRMGQQLLENLASMSKPSVAAIHGAALGGGLETALACTHRIATDSPKTIFALPEVQLGLIPGAGGTQRLPRLIGLQAALDMILTGRNVRAGKAHRIGLVDELVHPSILRSVARQRARELADDVPLDIKGRSRTPKEVAAEVLLDDNVLGRKLVFRKARENVLGKTRGHFPAPLAALDVVQRGYDDGFEAGLADEARQFGDLAVNPITRELVYLFFATTALKKDTGLPAGDDTEPLEVKKVGILGAGFMGAGIASVAVQAGTVVRLKDASTERVAAGWQSVHAVLSAREKRKSITRAQLSDMMSLLGVTLDYRGFANVDLVIEAVFEDLLVKQQVMNEVTQFAPYSIFASNTSTIPIGEIASASSNPENVVGMHFFSPVHRMPLLEVVVGPNTSSRTVATAVQYGKKIGKTVIVVRDGAGFYVNRILAPYINESGYLLADGASIDSIDKAAVEFGFPVGPLTLLDEVGLDIAAKSGPIMASAYGERMARANALQRVIDSGRLGRKNRRGFYRYDEDGKRGGVDESVYKLLPMGNRGTVIHELEIQRRTVFAMLNEAVRCLEEGVIRSARDGDIGAVFGIGFPAFRGGPFRYLDSIGAAAAVRQLDDLNAGHPGRFEAASLLRSMAESEEQFHVAPERMLKAL